MCIRDSDWVDGMIILPRWDGNIRTCERGIYTGGVWTNETINKTTREIGTNGKCRTKGMDKDYVWTIQRRYL